MPPDTRIEDLDPSDADKVLELVRQMERIDAGLADLMMILNGACKMANAAQAALDAIGCLDSIDCEPTDRCLRCRALNDMAAIAREFSP